MYVCFGDWLEDPLFHFVYLQQNCFIGRSVFQNSALLLAALSWPGIGSEMKQESVCIRSSGGALNGLGGIWNLTDMDQGWFWDSEMGN